MLQSRVSVRGQTVIPREIRESLGIAPSSILEWKVENGVIHVYPLPGDPVRASVGLLRGKATFQEFLDQRNADRLAEHEREG